MSKKKNESELIGPALRKKVFEANKRKAEKFLDNKSVDDVHREYQELVRKKAEAAVLAKELKKKRDKEKFIASEERKVSPKRITGKRGRPKKKKGTVTVKQVQKNQAKVKDTTVQVVEAMSVNNTNGMFDEVFLRMICNMAKEGMSVREIASIVGVTEVTIRRYGNTYADFFTALQEGRRIADSAVEVALFAKATGYVHKETRVFAKDGVITDSIELDRHYPPDTEAIKFWLKNRKADNWKDKAETTIEMGESITSLADARRIIVNDIAEDLPLISDNIAKGSDE